MKNSLVYCFKIFWILVFSFPLICFAQLQVNQGQTPSQLVQNVLLGGGVTAFNVNYTGSLNAIGYFNGQNSNIGLQEGIILSTGQATNAIGPNNDDGGLDYTDFFLPGYAPLTNLFGNSTNDAAILEFDFVPISDSLSFRYVFASEEYPEYVNGTFNDVFGFFISGPGIVGSQNIALVPGTTQPVAIDNINAGIFDCFTGQPTGCANCNYYVNNCGGQSVEYDGFTTVLEAKTVVTACDTYHIVLAIVDAVDGAWDSGVFLEAGSFSAGTISISASTTFNPNSSTNDTNLVEGCGKGIITFERAGVSNTATVIPFQISGTATNGVDYDMIPDSVVIPAGQTSATLNINAIIDGQNEGTETIILTLSNSVSPCASSTTQDLTLTISDSPQLNVTASGDTTLICPIQVPLSANASGGMGGYEYTWSNGAGSGSTVNVSPIQTTTYVVTATDTCGTSAAIDSVTVLIPSYNPMHITVTDDAVCRGNEAKLFATVMGGSPPLSFEWENSLSFTDTLLVRPQETSIYVVEVTDSCGVTAEGRGDVEIVKAHADFEWDYVGNRSIYFENTSPDAIYTWWDFDDGLLSEEESPTHIYPDSGTFVVTQIVENKEGCLDTITDIIITYADFHVYIPSAFTPGRNNINDVFFAKGEGYVELKLDIFDRWGGHIFQSISKSDPWDGFTKYGQEAPTGIYHYRYQFTTPLGETIVRQGHLTLIR